jgi:hypothetical protein
MAESLINLGSILATFVSALVAFIAILISDKIMAHEIEIKQCFIIAVTALFIGPLIGAFIAGIIAVPDVLAGVFAAYLVPLLIWIILGELLLKIDKMAKLKVMVVAFVVYIVLNMVLSPVIFSLISI